MAEFKVFDVCCVQSSTLTDSCAPLAVEQQGAQDTSVVHTCVQLFCSCENCVSMIERRVRVFRTFGALAHDEELNLLNSKPANH